MSKTTEFELPDWASADAKGRIVIDPDKAYPEILKEVLPALGLEEPNRYAIEVAYQFAKLHVLKATAKTRARGKAKKAPEMEVRADGGRKERWRVTNFPEVEGFAEGSSVTLATNGRGARGLYQRLYGFVPQ